MRTEQNTEPTPRNPVTLKGAPDPRNYGSAGITFVSCYVVGGRR